MADRSTIEWTDATWNPVQGCTRVSEGCRNCYAEVMAARFSDPGQWGHGLAQRVTANGKTDHRWTGELRLNEKALDLPLRWKRPRKIFVNSTSDLFHEKMPDEWIDRVFAVMALAPQHTFQVLTKRPERMAAYMTSLYAGARQVGNALVTIRQSVTAALVAKEAFQAGYPNVWLGTSIEDQATADQRIPHLLNTPAAVRFISAEPLLGPVDMERVYMDHIDHAFGTSADLHGLDWVIVGGESGPGARPMHPYWARSLRDQCQAAGVKFFFKQWGKWGPPETVDEKIAFREGHGVGGGLQFDGTFGNAHGNGVVRKGKARAGRLLDGREWNEVPG
jgi:protein gp37